MKLSDALVLGNTVKDFPLGNGSWSHCLVGVSLAAFSPARRDPMWRMALDEFSERWQWATSLPFPTLLIEDSPELPHMGRIKPNAKTKLTMELVLTILADHIVGKRITFEQAVEYVRSIEPPDLVEAPPTAADKDEPRKITYEDCVDISVARSQKGWK